MKLGAIRGRINAALAAMPAPTVRIRRDAAHGGAAPRYEVRWPQDRWHVPWPVVAERLTLAWPQ